MVVVVVEVRNALSPLLCLSIMTRLGTHTHRDTCAPLFFFGVDEVTLPISLDSEEKQ